MTNIIPIRVISGSTKYRVELTGTAAGKIKKSTCAFMPPWTEQAEMMALYVALENLQGAKVTVLPKVFKAGQKMGIFTPKRAIAPGHTRQIGRVLFDSVFSTPRMRSSFVQSLSATDQRIILLQIPPGESLLHAYPWELLNDHTTFLFNDRKTHLIRSIVSRAGGDPPKKVEMCNLLIVDPRPVFKAPLATISQLDRKLLRTIFKDCEGLFDVQLLSSLSKSTGITSKGSTLTRLNRFLNHASDCNRGPIILHIDTHGAYGWLCPDCNIVNQPGEKACGCGTVRTDAHKELGYLAFENKAGGVEWIDGERLGSQLSGCPVQLVVLSACKSGQIGGSSAHSSVAGMLVYHGIPAVVGMQYSILVTQATAFSEGLYTAIRQGKTIAEAVSESRLMMDTISPDHWYRPALFLRHDPRNPGGDLFLPRTSFEREATMAKILETYQNLKPGDSRSRILNMFGPEGLGKTSLLQEIQSRWKQTYPIVYLPLQTFLAWRSEESIERGKAEFDPDKILMRLIIEIASQLGKRDYGLIGWAEKSKNNLELQSVLLEITAEAEADGKSVIVLLDDFDKLSDEERAVFIHIVLRPLLKHTLIILTSQNDLKSDIDTSGIFTSVEASQMMSSTSTELEKDLPDSLKFLATDIYEETGGLPPLMEKVIAELKMNPVLSQAEFLQTQPERVARHHHSQPVKRIIWGPDATSEKIITVISVLRRFDHALLQKMLPVFLSKEYQSFQSNWFIDLLDQMGSKVEWPREGRGYTLNPSIKKPAALYEQLVHPPQYRKLHKTARDCYRSWLNSSKDYQPIFLLEMLYHQLQLMKIGRKTYEQIYEALSQDIIHYLDHNLNQGGKIKARERSLADELEKDPDLAPYHLVEAFNAALN